MAEQESLRSHSMSTIQSNQSFLKKLQDQDGIISLMQAQVDFQNELISKHDKMFEDLINKVQELSSKVQTLDDARKKGSEAKENEAARSALWSGSTSTVNSSLAEIVKETAEQALGNETGFVFDEKLGLYFDQSSGYYYDPIKQLYYNGHTKTFYSYDASTNTYQIHSTDSTKRKKDRNVRKQSKIKKVSKVKSDKSIAVESVATHSEEIACTKSDSNETEDGHANCHSEKALSTAKSTSDMEEGEISSSPHTSPDSSPCSIVKESESSDESLEEENVCSPKSYPPCIRAVVQESSDTPDFKKGSLFVVPFTGGTIGSIGSHHAILLQTSSVEMNHAKIYYEHTEEVENAVENTQQDGKYYVMDLGSTHGTYLNRTRLSESGVSSEPKEIVHGSVLQVGDVRLSIHIHPGDYTCGLCEPGLILQKEPMYEYTSSTAESVRRSEIKKIKKKYGLDRKNANAALAASDSKYVDRAKTRRSNVGSDNPFAKTDVASVETPIRESNVGFKMLQKMGWKGEGLGKPENEGIKEPINCEVKTDRLGLGVHSIDTSAAASFRKQKSKRDQKRLECLTKTMERFNETKVLHDNDIENI